jgi:hypothetical protein
VKSFKWNIEFKTQRSKEECETQSALLMTVYMVIATLRNTLHFGLELVHT